MKRSPGKREKEKGEQKEGTPVGEMEPQAWMLIRPPEPPVASTNIVSIKNLFI